MAPRAIWKGFLKVAELSCPVALYAAVSTTERIAFHTLNRNTGHRVHRQFVDPETAKMVPAEAQVKGYEVGKGEYVVVEPDEIAAALPVSDKTLAIQDFINCNDIDDVYFDRPYYVAPTSPIAEEAFAVIREGMRTKNVAALARAVLFRRMRTVLIRPHGVGISATTLHFNYEVRAANEAFSDIPELKIEGEMLDLAKHIIKTKQGSFDPNTFEDRYEAAVANLVRAKLEGKPIEVRKPAAAAKVVDLMEALRQSAGVSAAAPKTRADKARAPSKRAAAKQSPRAATPRRKTG